MRLSVETMGATKGGGSDQVQEHDSKGSLMAATPDRDLNVLVRVSGEAGLAQTLASLDVISRPERWRVEVVIADDTENPRVAAALEAFAESGAFQHVELLRGPWKNAAAAWNAAFRRGRGVWVLRLEQGDEVVTDPLPFIDRHPAATAIQCAYVRAAGRRTVRRRPTRLTERNSLRWLTTGNPIPNPSLLYRRAFANHPFDETLDHLHDWAYWLLNRNVFDRSERDRKTVIAKVVTPPVDFNRRDVGVERARIADRMANRLRFRLPRSLRNNLKLQHVCGLRQQGQRAPYFRTIVRIPADAALYCRSLFLLVLGRTGAHR